MFTEESLENVVIEYLKDIDYKYIHGSNLNRDNKEVLLLDRLEERLININKEIPKSSIKEAIRKIRAFETNDVFTNNKLFHKYFTEGVEVTDFINGETKYYTIKLIDYDDIENNDFLVVNQLEIVEECRNRIEELKKSELAISADESNEHKIDNVAINIIRKCGEITPLALQKLLYYSQAFYKLFTGDYLFDNDCEAWIHGPVYRCIYDRYKCFGRGQIEINDSDEILLDEIEDYIVGCVVRYFGCYSGKILEEMTHSEMPWILTRRGLKKDVGCNRIIEKEFIDTYFKNVKDKYKLISIDDIKEYSTTLFNSIN